MLRILTLTNWYPPHHFGGYEVMCQGVMSRFNERGHEVRVLCGDERFADRAGDADPAHEGRVRRELQLYMRDGQLYRPRLRERLAIERRNQAALDRQIEEFEPDVVSVWHMGAMSLGLLTTIARRRIPIVYIIGDDWPAYCEQLDAWSDLFARGVARRALGRVVERATGVPTIVGDLGATGAFCFISESTRRAAVSLDRWRFPLSGVVYPGVDRDVFPRIEAPADRDWSWRLLYTGRFDTRKGVETLLRALPLLPPTATLECNGRGGEQEQARLTALAAELGVGDRVSFTGGDRADLARRYVSADVFVFPSEWEEPFGLVPLEAMACGTPVVATGTGGSREFLRDGFNSLLFPPGDPSALAAAILRLHADAELRSRLVDGGLRTAEQFEATHTADELESWHVAAADRFAGPRPTERHPNLPTPGDAVRVGIVSWNTGALLDRCLAALPAALDGVDSSVVVVDNASDDGSAGVAERHPGVKVIRNSENLGYSRAMNRALSGSDADVLIALNPDTEPAPGSLALLAERLAENPDLGLVVPRLLNADGSVQHSVFRFPSPRQAAAVLFPPRWLLRRGIGEQWWAEGYAPHDRAVDIDWAIGAVHAVRASALAGEPPYEELSFMYVEDVDLCWRLAQRGWRRRLEPAAAVMHVGNAAGAQAFGSDRTKRWMTVTYDWYERTFGTPAMRRWAAVHTLAILLHLLRAFPRALLGRPDARARIRELLDLLPLQVRPMLGLAQHNRALIGSPPGEP
jgi:glycosyltransferase involved in cell wall biosynthesis/GT2 family glycosyltransferase